MKVKDLIEMDIDIDVYDSVCDDIGIAFVGAQKLTEAGKAKFAQTLELEVEICGDVCIVNVEDETDPEKWKSNLKNAKQFFWAAAGYCPVSDYERWFLDE